MISNIIITGPTASGKKLIGEELIKKISNPKISIKIIEFKNLNFNDLKEPSVFVLLPTDNDEKNIKDLFKKQEKRIYWKYTPWTKDKSENLFNSINKEYLMFVPRLRNENIIYTGNRDLLDVVEEIYNKI